MLSLVLSVALASSSFAGAGSLSERADAYLEDAVEKHRIPAISAGIVIDSEILWSGAAGFADLEKNTAVTPETSFRIASISKILTATAILQLVERGLIDLDAPVQTYLPDYPAPGKGTMKVRHLLSHTSGIRHSRGDESRTMQRHYASMIDACQFFQERKLAFAPGTKHRYSSYGYTVLGAIVESVTGAPFESYMAEHVWKPAGMLHTGLDRRPAQSANAASLYRMQKGRVVPDLENDLSLIYPAGGMVATAEDLLRFTIALDNEVLLSAETHDRMFERPVHNGKVLAERGGFGWNVWEHETHGRILSRVGGQSGTSALLVSYDDRGVTVVLLTNMARLDPIWELTNDLIGMGLRAKSGED